MSKFYIRPLEKKDFEKLCSLIQSSTEPIASLPDNEEILKKRLEKSCNSFQKKSSKGESDYFLFGLFTSKDEKLAGVSGIYSKAENGKPLYVYEVCNEHLEYKPFKIQHSVEYLKLRKITNPPSEVCSLYLARKYRKSGVASLLSYSRYLFIANNPVRFEKEIIANLRGIRDKKKESPFWKAMGAHFLNAELNTVDTMKSLGETEFIEGLMPKHCIYLPLLPKNAQFCVGKVHKKTVPAYKLLVAQGYEYCKWVDIFDAGAMLKAKITDLNILKKMKSAHVGKIVNNSSTSHPSFIANNQKEFRATIDTVDLISHCSVSITKKTAKILNVKINDLINYSTY